MNGKNKNATKILLTIIIIIVFFIFGAAAFIYTQISLQQKEIDYTLKELSQKTADVADKEIQSTFLSLHLLSSFIGDTYPSLNPETIITMLKEQIKETKFRRLGIVLPDGTGYVVQDDNTIFNGQNFAEREYFKHAIAGQDYFSDSFHDIITDEYLNAHATPIFSNGVQIGILAALTRTSDLSNIIQPRLYDDNGFSFIVKPNGTLFCKDSEHIFGEKISELYQLSKTNSNTIASVISDMDLGREGKFKFQISEEDYFAHYTKLNTNDWYIITAIPIGYTNTYFNQSVAIMGFVVLLVCILFVLLILRNHSMREENVNSITRIAYYDELTGCYNKLKFVNEARDILRNTNYNFAVVAIDVNNFKSINELFGITEGDLTLKHIAKILGANLKVPEIFARNVADRFYSLITYEDDNDLISRIKKIQNEIGNYVTTNLIPYHVVTNCGVLRLTGNTINLGINYILDCANLALQDAKMSPSMRYSFHTDVTQKLSLKKNQIENDMRKALENNEFTVYLQPKFDIHNNSPIGAEALVRWIHPVNGFMYPSEFLPIFEKNGFIVDIDIFVFDEICRKIRDWLDADLVPIPISVNLSKLHLFDSTFVESYKEILEKYDVPAHYIELELTESIFFADNNTLFTLLEQLHDVGFRLSMDDFGSGYSSLNMLKDIPLDVLKIDRVFFLAKAQQRSNLVIKKIVELAHDLDMSVVAEGVENSLQVEYLKVIECNIVQSYLYAKPMPIREFEELVYPNYDGSI